MTHDPPRPLQFEDPWAIRPGPVPDEAEELLFHPTGPLSLREVVEHPARSLSIEYKSWRNLRNAEDQGEIARDIAGLANHGGGALAFGFDERTLAPVDIDPFRTPCDQAALDQILRLFLDPAPRCEMLSLPASNGSPCTVIRVGPHGAVPVFVRTHGLPEPALRVIQPGAVYVRRHAPPGRGEAIPRVESAPVSAPSEWMPLLRRCVRGERDSLLGAIEAAIEGRRELAGTSERLRLFHQAAHAAFLTLADRTPAGVRMRPCHHIFSYAFDLGRPEILEPAQMPELLSRAVLAVQQHVRMGPRMFDPPYRRGARPRFVSDSALPEQEVEVLETAWLRDRSQTERTELWRVSAHGMASTVRPYAEDSLPQEPNPGAWLSPNLLARDLAELVLHARAMGRLFGSARAVVFRCEWRGLAGRRLYDPSVRWVQAETALADHRVVLLQVPLARLSQSWPETAARLMAPVLRMIEPDLALDADWVSEQAAHWT